jgi:hypothetical protein
MEFLKKLGFTEAEINGTEEEKALAIERVKKTIEDNVRNDKTLFEEYTKKGKDESYAIALKKVEKALGIKREADDTLDSLLEKGKTSLTANTEKAAKDLQDELIASKAELLKFNEEILPSEIAKVRNEVNKVYIDNSINGALSSDDFKELLLSNTHRANIFKTEIEAHGGEFKYDPTTGKTKLVQKDSGLKFQLNGATFDETDITGPAKVILADYFKKSNGGAGGAGAPAGIIIPAGTQVSSNAQNDLNKFAELAAKAK